METDTRRPLGWTKRRYRNPVALEGELCLRDDSRVPVTIYDATIEGCGVLLHALHMLPIGQTVRILLPQQPERLAVIRWVCSDRAGLAFVHQK